DLFSGGGLFEVKLGHAAGEDDTEAGAEFVAECAVTLGLGGLALEGGHLAGYFVEDVVDAGEIEAGGFETEFGEAFLGLETGGAGLGLGDGLFRFGGVLLAEAGLVPVRGSGLVDDDFGFTVEAGSVVDLGIDEGEGDLGHSGWLAVAGAGEDDVFHLDATEGFGGLLAEDPGDGVGDVGLAAAVGADDGGDAFAGELDLSAITEGLEAEDLDLLELEQM